ncbi:MAG TPA: DUF1800 domain-containing protein [Bryobacteraceae bacterium]|nr:DUF1800 domain-containing protein [Bryobacteraceae bacterium]
MRKLLAWTIRWSVLAALVLASSPASFGAAKTSPTALDYSAFGRKLSKEEQILQAVNRLTFGPRPGDVEEIRKLGVKKWIDLQLHPERILENPALAGKLEPLESLRLTQADAARNYPNPQMIRAIVAGREPMPEDPVTRAAVQSVLHRVRVKRDMPESDPLDPVTPLEDLLSRDQIRALRNGTLDEKRAVLAAIPENKVDDVVIALPPGLRFQLMPAASAALRRKLMLMNAPQQLISYDLTEGKLLRAILSNRQLEQELVDFWYNHFNVFLDKGADRFLVPSYEREAIRPRVLAHFRDLLEATALSPAMLFYLDNWQSVAPNTQRGGKGKQVRGLNENYARELMELHTLGVDGGYTQKDVTEVARCFTGWTIRAPRDGGGFFFNERVHDKGEKVVLGVTIAAGGGKEDGERVLDILANHPSTARFISRKLAERFVADDPPPELVARMAKTFHDTHGDIRAVLKTAFTSKEFFSQGAYRAKMKSPFEMIVSAVRATGADVDFAFPLGNRLTQLGEPLYRKLEPTGYSNLGSEWTTSASLLARMNFALDLVQNRVPGVKVNASAYEADTAGVARQILFRDASPETQAALEKAVADQREKNPNQAARPGWIAGLVLGSPDFQRR